MTNTVATQIAFKRILVPTDFSDVSRRALDYAEEVARKFGSELVVAHASQFLNPIAPPEALWIDQGRAQQLIVQQNEEQLEQIGEALRSDGFQAQTVSDIGPVGDEILRTAETRKVDLIVMATEGKKGFDRLLLGSDTEHVIRRAECPVLVIGPKAAAVGDQVWHPRNVLCAVDLAPSALPTAIYACQLSNEYHASLTFFHVEKAAREAKDDDLNQFDRALTDAVPPIKDRLHTWKTLVSEKDTGLAIVDEATREHADLIVMGAHGASGAAAHGLRGVAPHVFAEAHCPVMILPGP